ncbi:TPA: helix-turn-helix transcriptional regulator [Legionella pneumophila]|nr:helix-turn-helix transcriptional regulator [Legionella pneumophila]
MTYNPIRRTDELRNEVMNDPEARAVYEATKLQIELALQLKEARIKKNMTQEDVATLLHTKKPAISRLEKGHESIKSFPSLLTLVKFASAIGYELKIHLEPIKR